MPFRDLRFLAKFSHDCTPVGSHCCLPAEKCRGTHLNSGGCVPIDRRQLLFSLAAGVASIPMRQSLRANPRTAVPQPTEPRSLRRLNGEVDWRAVRELFP